MDCKVCGNTRSPFVMNNRLVCFRCDELLIDLEIELEETDRPVTSERPEAPANTTTTNTVRTQKP